MSNNKYLERLRQTIVEVATNGRSKQLKQLISLYLREDVNAAHLDELTGGPEQDNLLHCVVQYNKQPLSKVRFLLNEYGMDPCKQNGKGKTAFYMAAGRGHINIMDKLRTTDKRCCDIATYKGYTPACVATVNGRLAVLQYLKNECHYDLNQVNQNNKRPLDYANPKDHPQLYQFLKDEYETYKQHCFAALAQTCSDELSKANACSKPQPEGGPDYELAGAQASSYQKLDEDQSIRNGKSGDIKATAKRQFYFFKPKPRKLPVKRVRSSNSPKLFDDDTIKQAKQQIEQIFEKERLAKTSKL